MKLLFNAWRNSVIGGAALVFFASTSGTSRPVYSVSSASASVAASADADIDDPICDEMAVQTAMFLEARKAGSKASTLPEATIGGDIPPVRSVEDPYPTLHSVAIDPENNRVVMSDFNRGTLLFYERTAGNKSPNVITTAAAQLRGPATGMMFVAGVAVDPADREVFTVDNDIGDRMVTYPYDAEGNIKPKRVLTVPHGSWGVSYDKARDQIAVSVEHPNTVVVYRREAEGHEKPVRTLHGQKTGLADPHGIAVDDTNNEMTVVNHGNWAPVNQKEAMESGDWEGGHFQPPSINTYPLEANGDIPPTRIIQGKRTQLNWPMGVSLDTLHNEIAIANYADDSILIYRRTDSGDVAPARVIHGKKTGISRPMGVAFDTTHDEIWVTNSHDHSAVVFPRTASGNSAPLRMLRSASTAAAVVGFGNPGALSYDSTRSEIIVPNCVSDPSIMIFSKTADGDTGPVRVIEGQRTKLSRTMHGIVYDAIHDEIIVPVNMAGAVLVFRGAAQGEEPPIRTIQGPHTQILHDETLALDPVNNEILVGETTGKQILAFPRTANGDVPPLRIIRGPKTGLTTIRGLAVDTKRNLIIAASSDDTAKVTTGLFIFNRTDNGDVAPRYIIAGPKSGILRVRQVEVDSDTGKLYLAVKNNIDAYDFNSANPSPWNSQTPGFIGVWNDTDNGDVPPRAMLGGLATGLVWPAGIALNYQDREVYVIDSVTNGMFAFFMPEFFPKAGFSERTRGRRTTNDN
jgi:DNA-binding beta-propeller fold protein YncE